jgi:hypothetical protein
MSSGLEKLETGSNKNPGDFKTCRSPCSSRMITNAVYVPKRDTFEFQLQPDIVPKHYIRFPVGQMNTKFHNMNVTTPIV